MEKKYLFQTSLKSLVGPSPALKVIERASAVSQVELKEAIAELKSQLCPFPALRIADWFWETEAGQTICRAEWVLYQEEAMRPAEACRALWGQRRPNKIYLYHLALLRKRGRLHVYWLPRYIAEFWPKRDQFTTWPTYLLRSEVRQVCIEGRYWQNERIRSREVDPALRQPQHHADSGHQSRGPSPRGGDLPLHLAG